MFAGHKMQQEILGISSDIDQKKNYDKIYELVRLSGVHLNG